jgi:hypothetical protein
MTNKMSQSMAPTLGKRPQLIAPAVRGQLKLPAYIVRAA